MKALLRLGTFKYNWGMSENKRVISDEAVEAAAKFLLDGNPFNDEEGLWEIPSIRDHYLAIARGTIEAAAASERS